jgi:curved DNA-binding protein
VLGVSRTATPKEVKSAFRKLSKEYHPDLHPGKTDLFKEMSEAYDVLGDADKRKRYDALGNNWKHGSSFNPPPGYGGGAAGGYGGGAGVNVEDLFGAGAGGAGFSDFFDMFFNSRQGGGASAGSPWESSAPRARSNGGAGRSSRASHQSPQKPLELEPLNREHELRLTLEELATGTEKTLLSPQTRQKLTVSVPKGAKIGGKIRLAGHGHQSQQGAKTGDLLLKLVLEPHSVYQAEGLDLLYTARLPVESFALGCELSVPLLQGGLTLLTIPPEVQVGQRFRLLGQGLPGSDEAVKGNLLVTLSVVLPDNYSQAELQIYRQLRELRKAMQGVAF